MIDLNFIKQWEGCRLVAYKPLPNDKWTIGYGATGGGIGQGTVWTSAQADTDLKARCLRLEDSIRHALDDAPICNKKMTALVSLAYNIGLGALFKSTLFSYLHNKSASNVVADQFRRFSYSGGVKIPGLVARREAERKLFLEEV